MCRDLFEEYHSCKLCAHRCGVDRRYGVGRCGMFDELLVARAALHMWEEPPISATNGSGTVFFSGCSLSCVFCQNREISRGKCGRAVSCGQLADIMLALGDLGAHNINLVTPTHFVPHVVSSVAIARERGLTLPIVYNTSSYETPQTLKLLSGCADVYLADFKYMREKTAREYSAAPNYVSCAKAAIDEMVRQQPMVKLESGIMTRGVIVRILLLPGHIAEAKLALKYIHDTYKDSVYVSLMNQYTPPANMPPPINRRTTLEEYRQLLDYADRLGVVNGFIQSAESASESFIPPFCDNEIIGLK